MGQIARGLLTNRQWIIIFRTIWASHQCVKRQKLKHEKATNPTIVLWFRQPFSPVVIKK